MEKIFNPAAIEQTLYQEWESQHYFTPTTFNSTTSSYCIVIPPPNVTGSLHMGHGFQQTLMDVLVRYHRMSGDNTLWVVGTDHASIAAQMIVERQLNAEGTTREELGRENFLQRAQAWKAESGGTITQQMRRLGISVDWTRERFTMDPEFSHAVLTAFEKLYDDGLIYRGTRLVNWDPIMRTAISDLEVVNEESAGHIYHLRYPLAHKPDSFIVVATTRPETLFGDVAVAVHPADERYQDLIGQYVQLPLTDRKIIIIADDYVDPEFGTGCVKITPAHDFNDHAVGLRHTLPILNIFTDQAILNENVPTTYQGLERFEARKKVIADLTNANLIEKILPHTLQIPRNERGGAILEPYLTEQWYVKTDAMAKAALKAVQDKETNFIPENWTKTYYQWLENIQDWCISRQLWWGHRIPAYYDQNNKIYVGSSEALVREKYKLSNEIILHQDEDVLDTWFSAALWPFATLGWPHKTPELEAFYPTAVLVTGFDIIFFWVARMMMFGLYFMGQVPFKEVYITGLIRDEKGQKMSKTKGNVLDPIDLVDGIEIDKLVAKRTYGLMQPSMRESIELATRKQFPAGISASGTDALRFTYCALATQGRDIRFDLGRLEGYRNFCNKLWNASRFVLMNTEGLAIASNNDVHLTLADRWIVSKLEQTIQQVRTHFDQYRFDLASQSLYEFVWYDYCDWYLEFSKIQLNDENISLEQKASIRKILLEVLENSLRLLHPIMPFITETIWQQVQPLLGLQPASIMLQAYPETNTAFVEDTALSKISLLQNVVLAVRNIRGEMNIAPSKLLPLFIKCANSVSRQQLTEQLQLLIPLAKLASVTWLNPNDAVPPAAAGLANEVELFIPLAGLIDTDAEIARLEKEIAKFTSELERSRTKLSNTAYVAKAPQEVVKKEQAKLVENEQTLEKLKVQLEKMAMTMKTI